MQEMNFLNTVSRRESSRMTLSEAVAWRVSLKKVLLKIPQNSQ